MSRAQDILDTIHNEFIRLRKAGADITYPDDLMFDMIEYLREHVDEEDN